MTPELTLLFTLTLTMGVYFISEKIYVFCRRSPLAHPVFLSIASLIGFLVWSGWEYEQFRQDTQFIHFLLGPTTVALAIPLYEQMPLIKKMALPLLVACFIGALVAASSAALISALWTGDLVLSLSLMPKSITTPIAMDLSLLAGGSPSLTAGIVLITGVMGCLIVPISLRWLKIKDDATQGLIIGITAHGIGTAQAFEKSATCGAFAGLAMSLTGVISAFVLPVSPLTTWVERLVGG
ncbi:LrgB family protein [Reinekea marina]|uniref:LrgB family protein n=1 Tax=Reinekea marina TaxID=1310421 RepID=A0ABV7WNK9_9GAMM|nr:LrgB family protein [Reinekea marina]MDN3650758.1 LrgB family protein [Reinekea marina]